MKSITTLEGNEELTSSVMENSDIVGDTVHRPSWLYFALKRFLDIVLAVFGLVLLIPIFFAIAVCIKLEDRGNILYFRKMVGLRGQPFTLIKFRSMIANADTYLEDHAELKLEFQKNMKLQDDPRVTRMGRFLRRAYLDEVPQLFNVLLGQMSFVGPRAIHQCELALYGEYAEKRHFVKPGITGLWQINPNRHRYYEERISLDMQYIDTRSFLLDLVILLKTAKVLIAQTGV